MQHLTLSASVPVPLVPYRPQSYSHIVYLPSCCSQFFGEDRSLPSQGFKAGLQISPSGVDNTSDVQPSSLQHSFSHQ